MLRDSIKHFFLVIPLLFFFCPQIIYAAESPNLISPTDNSTETKSPKLTWQYSGGCVESGSCFRVEVDNSADFSSIEKSTYTNSFSYSPQNLTEGVWNWRVKAKDKAEKWSDWSKVFKFTVGPESAVPSPSSSSTTQPTPSASSSSSKSESIFNIKDAPSEINSNQEFEIPVFLKFTSNPGQIFYLKGAFKKEDSSNYFGQTYSGNEWVKNNEKYSKQFKVSTDASGSWEGKIKVMPDADDSGFDGSGNYVFKTARYSESGSGPIWSNELNIKINAVEVPVAPKPKVQESVDEEPEEVDFTASLVKAPIRDYEIKIASIAGEATKSHNIPLEEPTRVLEDRKVNWLLITLGVGILLTGVGFTYFKFRSSKI